MRQDPDIQWDAQAESVEYVGFELLILRPGNRTSQDREARSHPYYAQNPGITGLWYRNLQIRQVSISPNRKQVVSIPECAPALACPSCESSLVRIEGYERSLKLWYCWSIFRSKKDS